MNNFALSLVLLIAGPPRIDLFSRFTLDGRTGEVRKRRHKFRIVPRTELLTFFFSSARAVEMLNKIFLLLLQRPAEQSININ